MLNSIKTLKRYRKATFIMFFNKIFLSKNTFKVTLQHLLNVFVLFNTVSFIEINLKLKIDPKMFTFRNLENLEIFLKKRVATLCTIMLKILLNTLAVMSV